MSDILKYAQEIAGKSKYIKTNFLASKHDGMRYIRYRIFRPILKLYTHYLRSKFKPAPWLTPTSIAIFEKILKTDMTGLEYGSGSSTLFFAPRLKQLISIEHSEEWYHKVLNMIQERQYQNVELYLIPEKEGESARKFSLPESELKVRTSYAAYFSKILEYPDNHFHFILIDGRARVECLLNSISKLKNGGILALDNSERPRYQPVFKVLKDWNKVETTNGLTNTTLWFKP